MVSKCFFFLGNSLASHRIVSANALLVAAVSLPPNTGSPIIPLMVFDHRLTPTAADGRHLFCGFIDLNLPPNKWKPFTSLSERMISPACKAPCAGCQITLLSSPLPCRCGKGDIPSRYAGLGPPLLTAVDWYAQIPWFHLPRPMSPLLRPRLDSIL